jgi:hypothetical protein
MAGANGTAGSRDSGNPDDYPHTEALAKKTEPMKMGQTERCHLAEVEDRVTQWGMWSVAGEEGNSDDPDEDDSNFYTSTSRQIPSAKRRLCKHPTIAGLDYTGMPTRLHDLPLPSRAETVEETACNRDRRETGLSAEELGGLTRCFECHNLRGVGRRRSQFSDNDRVFWRTRSYPLPDQERTLPSR